MVGYTIAFGPSVEGWGLFGGLDYIGLEDVGAGNAIHGADVPDTVLMAFQMMFAIITPALISGAVAERMKFSAWVVFIAVWSVVVYAPMAHWVWSPDGFIGSELQAIDFAGGLVVHINAGAAALAAVLVLGPRIGFRRELMRPHALPLTLLGTGILWFGWFGFNAGSAFAADGLAANAFVTTQVAAGVAATTWAIVEWLTTGSPPPSGSPRARWRGSSRSRRPPASSARWRRSPSASRPAPSATGRCA